MPKQQMRIFFNKKEYVPDFKKFTTELSKTCQLMPGEGEGEAVDVSHLVNPESDCPCMTIYPNE